MIMYKWLIISFLALLPSQRSIKISRIPFKNLVVEVIEFKVRHIKYNRTMKHLDFGQEDGNNNIIISPDERKAFKSSA